MSSDERKHSNLLLIMLLLVVAVILGGVGLVVAYLPEAAGFAYVQGVGLVIGLSGLYIGYRGGVWTIRDSSFWLLIGGLLLFIGAQGFFQFIAPGM